MFTIKFNSRTSIVLLVFALVFCSLAMGDIYRWRGDDGTLHMTNVKPSWWTDEMDQMDPDSIIPPEGPTPFPGKFVGDKENRKFHRPECEQIYDPDGNMAIPDEKIIWFQSFDEAISAGYEICDHCKPAEADAE